MPNVSDFQCLKSLLINTLTQRIIYQLFVLKSDITTHQYDALFPWSSLCSVSFFKPLYLTGSDEVHSPPQLLFLLFRVTLS